MLPSQERMPIELREPDGSIVPHVLLALTQIIALVSPKFPYRRSFFTSILVILFIVSCVRPHFSNNESIVRPFTLGWMTYLSALEKIMFSGDQGPEHHFWRIDSPQREAESLGAFGPRKIKWAISMLFNMRGVRWNYEVKNVHQLPRSSKAQYLVTQLRYLIYYGMMADIVSQSVYQIFFGRDIQDTIYPSLRNGNASLSFLARLSFGMTIYYMMQIIYSIFAIIAVGLNISKKEDWPPCFGKVSDVTTVRYFWGTYWHQTLRRPLSVFPQALVDGLGIGRGTTLSAYIQLWLAFLISGLMHAQNTFMLPSPISIPSKNRLNGNMWFFLLQAAAITLEDFVQWGSKHIGLTFTKPSAIRKLVGYAWVIAVFWFSLPFAGDVYMHTRYGKQPVFEHSPSAAWVGRLLHTLK